jgi:hypothetical protein
MPTRTSKTGIRTGRIQCRAYTKEKFHAKAYITHAKSAVAGCFALLPGRLACIC